MSDTTKKVFAGCGVGCLLIAVALVGLGWMGYRWGKTAVEAGVAAEQAEARLEAEYGSIQDYTPPARLNEDRLEAFLAVREIIAPERASLSESIEALASADGEVRAVGGLRAARAGLSMAPRVLELAKARNISMLEVGMGPGEYAWIYWFTYNAWLGHPGGDSLLTDIMEASARDDSSMHMEIDGMDREDLVRHLRRQVVAMFRNYERALAENPDDAELSELARAELASLKADHDRLPWQDGLPEVFADGLEPFRERLEASYSRATNPFELLELGDGPHGVIID